MSNDNTILSDDELEIMQFIVSAPQSSSKEIGDSLHMSESTVKSKLSSIYKKCEVRGVNKRTAALVACLRKGWLSQIHPDSADSTS